MSKYDYGVDAVRVNPSPELARWLDKSAPKAVRIILIDYEDSKFDRRPSSSSDEIILAYREFKSIPNTRPFEQLYRYVLKPVRGITAEQIIEEGKGKYIADWRSASENQYPAHMPDKVTNGTVTTDWHFCFECFGGRSKSPSHMSVGELTRINHENRYRASRPKRWQITQLSFLGKEKVDEMKNEEVTIFSGKAASEALESYQAQKVTLMAAMNDIKENKKAYKDFIKNTYRPLTFKGWAKKQGCAAEPVAYRWYGDDRVGNDNEALRGNRRFISCTSKALETYDLAPYINQYSHLKNKEKTLRDNIKGYKDSEYRVPIHSAEQMMDDAVADLEYASRQIEEVYEQRRDNAEMAQMQAQNAAYADQEVNNSMNAIQKFNNQVDQVMEDNRRMIAQINSQVRANANNAKLISDQKLTSASNQTNNTDTTASADSASVKSEPAQQDADSKDSKQKQANRLVDSARDYKMTGTSTTYYGQDTAIDLAQTNLRNQAAKLCGDTFKTQITWSQSDCNKHESDDTYMCLQNGLVNCWEQRCETEYCGTQ
ncbi:hypothetical protein [Methylophaga thiooxydans]|uniref:Uncharacterized protein n=1 Tax=Methylophaga thiooxydans DMS010 TaxID=637616 RepID=C0N2Y1_9GAMM|nr:hypothetical protein [Methylophaga thiooxydans]EEF80827.1 hypothetical protein MDMS009_554 [Methylophaga thiooxydans DMS010]